LNIEAEILDKFDCILYGGIWDLIYPNFDNCIIGLANLFEVATTEGWIDMMFNGVDSKAVDINPDGTRNLWYSLFFILFILIGTFLMMNMFVGLVCDTFNRESLINGGNIFLTDNQRE